MIYTENQRTSEEQYLFMVKRAAEVMAEHIEKELPFVGTFGTISLTFCVPEKEQYGNLIMEEDLMDNASLRRISAAIRLTETDEMFQSYLLRGTNDEVITYLQKADISERLVAVFNKLTLRA